MKIREIIFKDRNGQKIKTSKWARVSFYCAVLGWLILLFWGFILKEILQIPQDNNSNLIVAIASIGLMAFALLTGIVGIVEINRGKGTVNGLGRIVVSLLAVFLFLFFMFLPYLGHRG